MDTAWDLIEAFASQPREAPEDANRGAEMIAERLAALGIPVTMHWPDLYLSLPKHAEVRAGEHVFRAKPPAFATSATLTAPLMYLAEAGGGTPLDRSAGHVTADVAGKIVLIDGFALPNFVAGLEAAGAAGVIAANPGALIHWGTVSTIWGTPEPDDLPRLPKIPSAAVNRSDGDALIAMAGQEVTLITELDQGWFRQALPVAEIRGASEPDAFVLLHGHHDSWDVGVGDNATGNAVMLAVAEALWKRRATLHRSVRIAWWPGHSTGRYGGSAWYADTFAIDLAENCVVHINCDSPGCRWATSYETIQGTSETSAAVADIVERVTGQTAARKRPQRNSDYTFFNIGVSGCFSASSMMTEEARAREGYYVVGGCGGNIAWHTETDTLEVADWATLVRDKNLYTAAVTAFAGYERLPLDWRLAVAEMSETLADYAAHADLSAASAAIADLAAALERVEDLPADRANALNLALGRVLIPINYVRGPAFTHDPALNVPPLPTVAVAADLATMPEDLRGFAETQLMRGQNRLVAALRAALRLVEAA